MTASCVARTTTLGRLHPLSYDAIKRPLARANRSDRRLTVREAEGVQSASMRHSTAMTRLVTIVGIRVRPNVSSSYRSLLLREHQVQVLNRSAGCAFAKVIENRGQQDVPVFHVRKYA